MARRETLRAPQALPPRDIIAFAHVVVAERTGLCVFDFNHQHRSIEVGMQLWREGCEPSQQRLISKFFELRPYVCSIEALGPLGGARPTLNNAVSGDTLPRTGTLAELLLVFFVEAASVRARFLDPGISRIIQIVVVGEPRHGRMPRAAVAASCRQNRNVDARGPELADRAGQPRRYAADAHDLRLFGQRVVSGDLGRNRHVSIL